MSDYLSKVLNHENMYMSCSIILQKIIVVFKKTIKILTRK